MIRYFLYTFTDGIQSRYVLVATKDPGLSRHHALEGLRQKVPEANTVGMNFVKSLAADSDFDQLVEHNEHYSLNFQEIDTMLNNQSEGVSIGEWVKD